MVESATKAKVGKAAQWEAALASVRAFRALVTDATPKAEESTEESTGRGGASDDSTDATEGVGAEETPETRGHALVVSVSGPLASLVKGIRDGSVVLTKEDRDTLRTLLLGAGQAAGVIRETKASTKASTKAAA